MLFNKLFTISAITTLAAATALPRGGGGEGPGGTECCESVQTAANTPKSTLDLLALIGIVISDLSIPIGLNCSPITVIGGGNGGWLVLNVFSFFTKGID